MTAESNTPKPAHDRGLSLWVVIPIITIFTIAAIATYDPASIAKISTPAHQSTNWFGIIGDSFAFYTYRLFGLGSWFIPASSVVIALKFFFGGELRASKNSIIWILTVLFAGSCLLQIGEVHSPVIENLRESLNIESAGGAVGYLVMTRFLAKYFSDFGASIMMIVVLVSSTIALIGFIAIKKGIAAIFSWALQGRDFRRKTDATYPQGPLTPEPNLQDRNYKNEQDSYLSRLHEQDNLRRKQREEEKAAKAAEKQRLKEEARIAKLQAKEAKSAVTKAAAENAPAVTQDGPYVLPDPDKVLNPIPRSTADHGDVEETSRKLIDTLKLFGIDAQIEYTIQGPVVTKYAVLLERGTNYNRVRAIEANLMGAMRARSLRLETPIPGEEAIGIEIPNRTSAAVTFAEIFRSEEWAKARNKFELPILFGKDAAGNDLTGDLAAMPHMLVAGATGQGKSVCLNSIINGLLMTKTPDELKLIMVDPKSVEFTLYAKLPHLIVPVITDNNKVVFSLHWAVAEMEKRLKMFSKAKVKNIKEFNSRPSITQTDMFGDDTEVGGSFPKTLPYIVVIIDEVADLMAAASKEVTPDISRLTAKARAAGIHLILATQRPDAKIITGTIKANIPGRVAFKTATAIDSRTILDDGGAENLIGRGDMLYRTKDNLLIRAQGAYISDDEINRILRHIESCCPPQFDESFRTKLDRVKESGIADPFADNENDPDNQTQTMSKAEARAMVRASEDASLFKRAIEVIINTNRASISHFQRHLKIGYNHSANLCDQLESRGVIGSQQGSGARAIILDQSQLLALFNEGAGGVADSTATAESDDSVNLDDNLTLTLEGDEV